MKIFSQKKSISSGVTCIQSTGNRLVVGSVDDYILVLDSAFNTVAKMKASFGTIDIKCKENSKIIRNRF